MVFRRLGISAGSILSFGLHHSFIDAKLPVGVAIRHLLESMMSVLRLHHFSAEAITGVGDLQT